MAPSRRTFLYSSGSLALAPLLPACGDGEEATPPDESLFRHGVASGDPLTDSVVLWTRVTPEAGVTEVLVAWKIATDAELLDVVEEGELATSAEVDFTVKVDVTGLLPGTTYYYEFQALGEASPRGRTRTAPEGAVERLRFAVVSCSNYAYGYFGAYAQIATRADLDAVIHLGDYIYEYGEGDYGPGKEIDRACIPAHEIVSLEDYRARHAQYKTDPDLREAHRQHPFIPVWDDHEVANNAWSGGAGNHDSNEGDYAARKAAARQAYFEWLPIRGTIDDGTDRVYRSFAFGDLVDLLMLDTRVEARDEPPADCDPAFTEDPARQLLGPEQEAWFLGELSSSHERGTRWRLIGQQVMMGQLHNTGINRPCPLNLDQWDGYGATRTRVYDAIESNAIDNVVVLTGDIHSSWAIELSRDPFDPEVYDAAGSGSLAVEFVTPAVTSPSIEDLQTATTLAEVTQNGHPHVKYVDLFHRGYLLVDVTHEATTAEWYHLDTITTRGAEENLAATYRVEDGAPYLIAATAATAPREDAPPLAP